MTRKSFLLNQYELEAIDKHSQTFSFSVNGHEISKDIRALLFHIYELQAILDDLKKSPPTSHG